MLARSTHSSFWRRELASGGNHLEGGQAKGAWTCQHFKLTTSSAEAWKLILPSVCQGPSLRTVPTHLAQNFKGNPRNTRMRPPQQAARTDAHAWHGGRPRETGSCRLLYKQPVCSVTGAPQGTGRLAKQSAPSFLADFHLTLLTETRALKPISTPESRNLSLFTLKTKSIPRPVWPILTPKGGKSESSRESKPTDLHRGGQCCLRLSF